MRRQHQGPEGQKLVAPGDINNLGLERSVVCGSVSLYREGQVRRKRKQYQWGQPPPRRLPRLVILCFKLWYHSSVFPSILALHLILIVGHWGHRLLDVVHLVPWNPNTKSCLLNWDAGTLQDRNIYLSCPQSHLLILSVYYISPKEVISFIFASSYIHATVWIFSTFLLNSQFFLFKYSESCPVLQPDASLIAMISHFISKPLPLSGKGEDKGVLKVKLQPTTAAQTTMPSMSMLTHMFSFDFS